MHLFFQQLTNGIAFGASYALIALGFAVVYSVLRMINFAYGNVYVFGVFTVLACLNAHVPAVIAIAAGLATGGLLAALVERIAYRPLRNAHPMMPLLTAVVSALILSQLTEIIFGLDTQSFPQILPSSVNILGLTITGSKLVSLGVAIVLTGGFTLLLHKTRVGRAIILMRQDLEVARLMGVPVDRMVSVIYALAGVLGVVGGLLAASTSGSLNVQVGLNGTVNAFVAAILGGVGSLSGAVVGGVALGVIQALTAAYISSSYEQAVSFGALVLVLLLRPAGLISAGRAQEARV